MEVAVPQYVVEFEESKLNDVIEELIVQTKRTKQPSLYPVMVKKYSRDALLQAYPALETSPDAWEYRRIVEYLLFSTFRDESGNVVIPHQIVAERVGKSTGSKGFSAEDWLNRFSQNVWRLDYTKYHSGKGLARTIIPSWPKEVQEFLDMIPMERGEDEMVYLVSGDLVSKSRQKRLVASMEKELLKRASRTVKEPRIAEFVNYLNSHSATVQRKYVRENRPKVEAMLSTMPTSTDSERHQKAYVVAALKSLDSFSRNIYEGKAKTTRIYTIGLSFHSLPRDFRKALLTGCVHLDAKSVQLAIVARLWKMPKMQAFLSRLPAPDIWQELYSYVQPSLDFASAKIAFKRAIYSIVFGMREPGLRWFLQWGYQKKQISGLRDEEAVERFLTHPLIAEALVRREVRLCEIKEKGYVIDKFKQRRDYITGQVNERSLLAAEVQSWEIYLMLSLLKVFEAYENLHLVSFLHDGISIHISDPAKTEKLIDLLQTSFRQTARSEGIETRLVQED